MDTKLLPSQGDLVRILKDTWDEGSQYVGQILKMDQLIEDFEVCIREPDHIHFHVDDVEVVFTT